VLVEIFHANSEIICMSPEYPREREFPEGSHFSFNAGGDWHLPARANPPEAV
jgi:hypothetical protein